MGNTPDIIDAANAVHSLSGSITENGFLVVFAATFILVIVIGFFIVVRWTTNLNRSSSEQFNLLFNKLVENRNHDDTKLSDNIGNMVTQINEVLTIVKDNQEGINERSKKYQTYTGTIKILKNYFGNMKLELIRESAKIIEKNHIDDREALKLKICTVVTNIDKKRNLDFREFYYSNACLSTLFPANINDNLKNTIYEYIIDRDRHVDKLLNDVDLLCSEYMNEMENKMQKLFMH